MLIGATTSNAKDEFELDITEPNFRFYTIEWIDEEDEYNNKYVCGTKVSTFDHSGRKFVFEYYYILKDNNKIVTRFDLNAVQISFETIEPIKTENLEIKLYASIILKDGKEIIGGPRNEENNYKGIAIEYGDNNFKENTNILMTLYKGGYDLKVYIMPQGGTIIPIAKNVLFNKSSEETLFKCLKDLKNNYNKINQIKGEVFVENVYRVG